jgi:hypothetical protein
MRSAALLVRQMRPSSRAAVNEGQRFLKIDDWMENLRFQRVSGAAGQEGEVRLVTSTQEGTA